MKRSVNIIGALVFLLAGNLVFAQKEVKVETRESDKSLLVKTDHKGLDEEAKKKAAAEEKAKLPKPYYAKANAEKDIQALIEKAKKENKNIMIQAGGNWCIWCLRFNQYVQTTPELKKLVDENYLYYHLNWSPENKNEKVFAQYGNPGENFGYPVFIVLDKNGKQIHTQDSAVLEEGKGYSLKKVTDFFNSWKPKS
ncbi:thioredoxin family protein [Chryseobacterium caseinilyticum]|uniref:Thioredoxin family protein n=1 Tax=Chryseobacterium caseinilyticum TaxID=2771428 RepID=A0ABR8Z984_9FLAO|nr:thioredoxin family protein [Chryseobacterium caseinilyticum]MBD8081844.1 thioredoxin family protein [Chryseobacterium caseinilyticum]